MFKSILNIEEKKKKKKKIFNSESLLSFFIEEKC